jgi:hypothetical protein
MSDNEHVIQPPQQLDMPARATLSASRGNASSIRRNLISAFNHIALQTRGAVMTRAITLEISNETGPQPTMPDSDSVSISDLSFPDQSPIDTTGAAPPPPPVVAAVSEEDKAEEECAEALRTVMAIIFERKNDLGDADYLEMTNLLKTVYETKDPRNLKQEISDLRDESASYYEELCERSKEFRVQKTYYINSIKSLNAKVLEQDKFNRTLKMALDSHLDSQRALHEDISDLKYENSKLWKTKFHYQNKLIALSKKFPEILEDIETKKEIQTIKKRKSMMPVGDLLIGIRTTPGKRGPCRLVKVKPQLSMLFK